MSSAKAALESDTKVLAFEAGRKYGLRVNTISAGPLGSRAAKAIGFIDDMIRCGPPPPPPPPPLSDSATSEVVWWIRLQCMFLTYLRHARQVQYAWSFKRLEPGRGI